MKYRLGDREVQGLRRYYELAETWPGRTRGPVAFY